MMAKIIAYGETRDVAIARMERALRETLIEGVHTTVEFCAMLLASHEFRTGRYHVGSLEGLLETAV